MDSSGLKILLQTRQKVRASGGGVVLVAPGPRVLKVLRLMGMLEVLPACATVDEAVAALGGT